MCSWKGVAQWTLPSLLFSAMVPTNNDALVKTIPPGVYSVQSMGLGGGFLLTHFDAQSGLVEALDAREAAPGASREKMFQ